MNNESTDTDDPQWCKIGNADTCHPSLENLTKWFDITLRTCGVVDNSFIKHRESALKHLAALITSELLIAKFFYYDSLNSNAPNQIIMLIFVFLAILSLIFAYSGTGAIKITYRSIKEWAVLVTKIAWAMGLEKIVIDHNNIESENAPVKKDKTFYVPRYFEDLSRYSSTEDYIKDVLDVYKVLNVFKKTENVYPNTYFWAWSQILLLGFSGFIIGFYFAWSMGLSIYMKQLYWSLMNTFGY